MALAGVDGVRVWRNNTGVGAAQGGFSVRYGLGVGSADLVGLIAPSGRFFALEVKGPKGKCSPDQVAWLAFVRSMGGYAAVVRSVPEALAAVEEARRG